MIEELSGPELISLTSLSMEFLRVVEDELRGLATEARRRHPVVQEAAERAILKLRNMREEYAVALRRQHEGQAPPLSMFRSQDLLRPFLLACNHSDASSHLIITAIRSMQYLINRDAILPSDAPNILRVLAIQSQSKDTDVQKRVLQTMVMVVTWKSCDMTEDTMAQALGVCLGLHAAKNATVRTAADMTVRQIISLLYDRVAEELGAVTHGHQVPSGTNTAAASDGQQSDRVVENGSSPEADESVGSSATQGALRCARLVFQDLCLLSRGEQGHCIKRTSVNTTLGLELVEQVLSQQPLLFRRFEELRGLLQSEVHPLILHTLRRKLSFPLLVRVVRAASTLCVTYGDLLPSEAHTILSTMLTSLGAGQASGSDEEQEGEGGMDFLAPTEESTSAAGGGSGSGGTSWAALLTLEAVHRMLSTPHLALELFRYGGTPLGSTTVVEQSVQAVSQYLLRYLSSQHSIQSFDSMAYSVRLRRYAPSSQGEGRRLPLPASLVHALSRDTSFKLHDGASTAGAEGMGGRITIERANSGSSATKNTRSSSSELLHENEAPSLEEAELLLWALHCMVDLSLAVGSLVDGEFGTSDRNLVVASSVALSPRAVLPEGDIREALRNMCEALWSPVLSSLSHVLAHCSDPLIVAMCADGYKAFAFAGGMLGLEHLVDGFIGSLCRFSLPQWHGTDVVIGGGGGGGTGGGGSGGGGNTSGGSSSPALGWNHAGALQSVLLVAHRLGNLLRGSWHVVLDTLEQAATLLTRRAIARPRWSPNALAEAELSEVEKHCAEILRAVERLVEFSRCLEDEALYTLMSSLQALAVVDLANSATVLPQERSARESAQGGTGQQVGSGGPGAVAVAAATGLVSMVGAAARELVHTVSLAPLDMTTLERPLALERDTVGIDDPPGNHQHCLCAWVNLSGPRAAMSGPSGGDARDARDPRNAAAKNSRGAMDERTRNPWISSRLVVECAVANTWRLSVVWELVSGHLRVVAKAREQATREYAVRALSELIVDSVQRLHPSPAAPTGKRGSLGGGTPTHRPAATAINASNTSASTVASPPALVKRASMGSGIGEGLGSMLLLNRARSEEGRGQETDEDFRWIFDANVTRAFVAGKRPVGARELGSKAGDEAFEAVLFETMRLFAMTPHVDTREATLQMLYTILQSCGQVLTSAWSVILNLLYSVAKAATEAPRAPAGTSLQSLLAKQADATVEGGIVEEHAAEVGASERPVAWGRGCLQLAFKCLQLIVDDFLERVPREEVPLLVTCTGAFGRQTESVNLSLTAIGMLWSVCDTFADATVHAPDAETRGKLERSSAASRAGRRVVTEPGDARLSLHAIWPAMLFELRSLAVDFRPELRNCAVNTMFSAAVGNGSGLTEEEWKQFLLEDTFPLIEKILESTNSASRGANTAVAPELKKGVRMLMHHTRDTDRKQWNETRVLAMQGLGRVLRAYVGDLTKRDWFNGDGGVWEKSLQVYRDACLLGSDSQEVALAGIDGITTMVLLVGKMGLKSVQVRAGTGMKIVDGTLQRAASTSAASSRTGTAGSPSSGTGKGESELTVPSPEFDRTRPVLYRAAWESMVAASGFLVDESGDVAPTFVQGLAAVYKAGMEEGAEFYPGEDGAERRTQELLTVLDDLMLPRPPPPEKPESDNSSPSFGVGRWRSMYLPKVTPGQRAILDFLQEDLRSGWQLALQLLAKYSVEIAQEREGGQMGPGVTAECAQEAASTLSAMMSNQVPRKYRALALKGLLREVSAPYVRHLEAVRSLQSYNEMEDSMGNGGTSATDASRGTAEEISTALSIFPPSPERYREVMQLVWSLLSDGLPCVSDAAADVIDDVAASQDADTGLAVTAIGATIKAVGSLAVSLALDLVLRGQGVARTSGHRVRGEQVKAVGVENDEFTRLFCQALTLVTAAVCRDVVPEIKSGNAGAVDVVRALVDMMGAVSLPHVANALWNVDGPRVANAGNNGWDEKRQTFKVAVKELCRMCAGKSNIGDWEILGPPLRRRACWHLLRCVWSTARCFRHMEDAVDLAAYSPTAGLSAASADDKAAADASQAKVEQDAERCTYTLEMLGELRTPDHLLTPSFRQLVTDNQAKDTREHFSNGAYRKPTLENENFVYLEHVDKGTHRTSGEKLSQLSVLPREDVELASLAEGGGSSLNLSEDISSGEGRSHLMVVCRALLLCTASKTFSVRNAAAELLAEANIPQAMDVLQDEVAALKHELREKNARLERVQAHLHQRDCEVGDLRAQIAASMIM